MEDKEKGSSPNIKGADVDLSFLPSVENEKTQEEKTVEADGIPIAEEDIKFRSKDIKKKDEGELFVKIEGANRIDREKKRAAKKKDEELTKRLLRAADEKKKAYKKVEDDKKAAKHKAKSWIRQYKTKKVLKVVHKLRFALIALVIVITGVIVTYTVILPKIEAEKLAEQKIANAKLIEENRTDMLKIYAELVGKQLTDMEVEEVAKKITKDAIIISSGDHGDIYINGTGEMIRFAIEKGKTTNFTYNELVGETNLYITISDGTVIYFNGSEIVEYVTVQEAIEAHILSRIQRQQQ